MARKRANLTDLLNDLTYKAVFEKFKLLCINRFKWCNLPYGIDERYIENLLFKYGKAIFFRDSEQSYMCLETNEGAYLNVYGQPLSWWATGFQYHKEYKAEDCVIIDNNKLRIPTQQFIMLYANKITEAERTMDVNIKACKTPVVFTCDEKNLLSFKTIFSKIDGNEPAIYADKGLNLDGIQAIQTGVKFLCNDINDYKNSVENDLLTFLGFNNSPVDKKERLITAEAESNNELIGSFLAVQLEARQRAVEEINALFGLNITVELRENVENTGNVKGGAVNVA